MKISGCIPPYLIALQLFFLTVSACVPVPIPVPVIQITPPAPRLALPVFAPANASFDRAVNAARVQAGRAPLASNAALDRVAEAYAAELNARGTLTHRDTAGGNATTRVQRAGIATCGAGENLGAGFDTAAQALTAWLASPGHRRNLLNSGYANYGLGRAGRTWVMVMTLPC
ncbi:CAP domain-containing protein [Loktanella sp. SALINAS62]|uniref:CAP domain-containing protein n=1 Tax=Loktanella sp. SALINAS62 TaxID=2706124 RepID=UPI001B8C9805|nr:CAP domain-containing protein [Loktanella sp. SALINAS62]MBS1303160.1 CAP domain-containing protein [Loktanella sp. SALINAS62]